jgi:hypothetical protein
MAKPLCSSYLTPEAPIIIIGNGRSGSTLLNQVLDFHPDIVMLGEMKFAAVRAWAALWEADANNKQRNVGNEFRADPTLEARIVNCPESHSKLTARLESKEYGRTAEILRRALVEWFCLSETETHYWGFKEIFNGAAFRYDWEIYDHLFPRALWLHIVRHPIHYACSAISHEGLELTPDVLGGVLQAWLDVFFMSRRRSDTGRYCEIKYEALVAHPKRTLAPVLDSLGIEWNDSCLDAMSRPWGERSPIRQLPAELRAVADEIPELREAMQELGYRVDEEQGASAPPTQQLQSRSNGRWQLLGPFWREEGHCWIFPLTDTDLVDNFRSFADEVGEWRRSPVRLFEDDQLLGPAHSMHFRIRNDGWGAYSHWQTHLMFSTSDNSDPNRNGRRYEIELG